MLISKQELCQLIPHDGAMCLLDGVEHWDDEGICCWSESHLDQGNPLRGLNGLPALHALEYGAQAMAVHGGLLAQKRGEQRLPDGYLVAIRNARFYAEFLDASSTKLQVEARRLLAESGNIIYSIDVSAAGESIAQARATVMQQTEAKQ